MLRYIRNKLFSSVTRRLENINSQLQSAESHLNLLEDVLRQTQARTYRRIRNSGSIQTGENEILAKVFSGLKIYLDPNDMAVAVHIAIDGIWEDHISRAWVNIIEKNDTVLDIGANFGYFGLLAGQFTDKKNSKVIFFEANPNIVPYINKSLSVNWLNEQSVVENLAVSDKNGKLTLTLLENYTGSSSVESIDHLSSYASKKMQINVSKRIEVGSVTIDSYCNQNSINTVDLIKMDIEGHEQAAYRGMRNIIKKSPRISLFIEFTKQSYLNPKKFYNEILKDFGYVYLINEDGQVQRPADNRFETVVGKEDDWVMPIFSKRKDLPETLNNRISDSLNAY